ncbi:MAG: hypothetical protein LBK47_10985 [Prevotellaceae bacterium]|jgi:carbon monoxide dehydrogenase subunit G|nr:hypothetical protein [Prevotellaceae bacterium]
MADYVSKVEKVRRPIGQLYDILSDFTKFSDLIPKDQAEDFEATENECTFTVKQLGKTGVRIIDKAQNSFVKYGANGKVPFDFLFWIQMKEAAPCDTRIKLTLRAELNMIMRGLMGKKLQKGIEQFAFHMAAALNGQ